MTLDKRKEREVRAVGGGILFSLVLVVGIVGGLFTLLFCLASVGAGEVGVRFDPIGGGVDHNEYGEGWFLKSPLVNIIPYSIKTQEYTMSVVSFEGARTGDDRIQTISKDSLDVGFDITILYRIVPAAASNIHQNMGLGYRDIILRPATRTVIRDIASEYNAMDMHQNRPEIADKIFMTLKPILRDKNIVLEKVLVRSIIRPQQIKTAIQNKLEAEQEAEQMEFVIRKEERERERKVIEAHGIAQANEIISGSLTRNYLTWYWIENLDTHNSVLYVPVGNEGIPLFREISEDEPTKQDTV